jgi:hypothetical protein
MSVESRVRDHLEGKNADWQGLVARWREADEARVLFCVPAPVRAALVVDAHVVALLEGARPTLVHAGDVTDAAFDAAQRLGVELVHIDDLPAPEPEPVPAPLVDAPLDDLLAASLGALPPVERALAPFAAESPLALEALVAAVAVADFPDLIEVPLAPLAEPEPLLVAPEPVPLLPAHVEAFPALIRVPDHALPGAFEPEYAVAALVEPAPLPEIVPTLPWATPAPAEAAPALELPEEEIDAMPWSPRYHHEIMAGSPRRVDPLPHPTAMPLAPQGPAPFGASLDRLQPALAPNWGLPWPRPPTPDGGLAMHDPALWGARERVAAVREDLALQGSASFGAVKPEGSGWLKRIQHFGAP